jgi:diguanylate cyclase (GGDEF)-like protein
MHLAACRRHWRDPPDAQEIRLQASTQLDPVLLGKLTWVHRVCFVIVALIAGATLVAWLVPSLGAVLPYGWALMKANTALAILLCGLGLSFSPPKQSSRMLLVSRILAAVVLLIAALTLVEYIFHISLGLDTVLNPDSEALRPGRMSPQTATSFMLMAVVLSFFRIRKGFGSWVVDLLLSGLCVLLLVMAAGYMFDAMHLFGLSPGTRTAPQTLACLMLLTFVVFDRRAEYGIFAIILGTGIGSRITRIACPIVLILPFLLEIGRSGIIHSQRMSADYATAQATALIAILAFALVLIMAWKIDGMEKEIHDLSLRDELTKLYNRRGFYVLAGQAFNLAQRSRVPFSVLFIDLNNLKQINDTLGHDTGSACLREVADLLRRSFRDTDVIGRIGGDEFVVAGESTETGINLAAMRLEQATVHRNAQGGHRYPLSISIGCATSDLNKPRSLEDLLSKADKAMYKEKQLTKQLLQTR